MSAAHDYLEALNPEQREAVVHSGSPLLILAGAGSGKTRVITTKIAYLIGELGQDPHSILAVTFTNKAAKEMRERAAGLESEAERTMIRTFHSFGSWFLRRNAQVIDIDPNFTIYDEDDSVTLLHSFLSGETRSALAPYASAIARAKDYCLSPESPGLSKITQDRRFPEIYAEYEKRLRKTGNVDFGDLIKLPYEVLEKDEAVRTRARQRFSTILVDEYQDSNVAQFKLLDALYGEGSYLCVVGDDDQSIYRFSGAEVRNILDFPKRFPGTRIIKLESNYRSTRNILAVADQVVARNEGRLGKTLRAVREGGTRPKLAVLDTQEEEAAYCARIVNERTGKGGSYSDIAILYRTNAQSLGFETDFVRRGIPFRVVGSLKFYDREEVKDALSLLAFIVNPRDEVAFRRIGNKPARGLGESGMEKILARALEGGVDLIGASESAFASLSKKAREGLQSFIKLVKSLKVELLAVDARNAETVNPEGKARGFGGQYSDSEAGLSFARNGGSSPKGRRKTASGEPERLAAYVERAILGSGLLDHHRSQDEIGGTQRAANLEELINSAALFKPGFSGLVEFLDTIELDRSRETLAEAQDAVSLITMHNTKGLEFPVVVVTGLEQGIFPREDDAGEDLEEQRRLFYVAITRAKDELYLTLCRLRRLRGRTELMAPSVFVSELPREEIDGPFPSVPASDPWKIGVQVYHEDYGTGWVAQRKEAEDIGPIVFVNFESGAKMRFVPKYERKLEIVSGE